MSRQKLSKPPCSPTEVLSLAFYLPVATLLFCLFSPPTLHATEPGENKPSHVGSLALFQDYCLDCHNATKSKGDINLEALTAAPFRATDFKTWELILEILQSGEMPPEDEPQPETRKRLRAQNEIATALREMKAATEGDPGPVVLRRMTSAEYNYAISDLTGLNLNLDRLIASDAVGGEGFSNVGEVQFVQDATIERYLEAAKTVASHALIGAGPLRFYDNPGKTGQELAAINRIQKIYRDHGFRTGAGEGAEAFGLDQYPKGFYATWRYRHRSELQSPNLTLQALAEEEALAPAFVKHLWKTLNSSRQSFPTSEIVKLWKELPKPSQSSTEVEAQEATIREACQDLYHQLSTWQKGLAANTKDDEEAAVLAEDAFKAKREHRFRVGISWPPGASEASFDIAVAPACMATDDRPHVVWENPQFSVRGSSDRSRRNGRSRSLSSFLAESELTKFDFGNGYGNPNVNQESFVTRGATQLRVTLPVPQGSSRGTFSVNVILDTKYGADCLVRCSVSDGLVPGETIASTGESAVLLADPESNQLDNWQLGVTTFARNLPQVSHREPAPSDRDPIPAPWDNSYNNPERNRFHYVIKYHRDDRFLTNYLIDTETRTRLDQAWIDLLTSFDYHGTYFEFVSNKFNVASKGLSIASLSQEWIDGTPTEAKEHVQRLFDHHGHAAKALEQAEPGHLDDVLRLASKAWRRELSSSEVERLRQFYWQRRELLDQDHPTALRALIARVLVSPTFIYRTENQAPNQQVAPLAPEELASRLSFFLWSSLPDRSLLQASHRGDLTASDTLQREVIRMLNDRRSKRFAREFFGQWLGFYQFDQYRGVDAERFPEFTNKIKASMYEEAISFFHHIVQQDRPIKELLFADYTFLNSDLASHYRLPDVSTHDDELTQVKGLAKEHRGGLLQLGAILTTTSAPLRTSAVKRGDWILRRILGTPVPPPPADAGSIPAEDVLADGLTVRARLEAHRTDPTCANCHSRIDPLGFALEHFDPIGRWRETYRDGQGIDDSGELSDGSHIKGINGLRRYLDQNATVFLKNLTTKLLGYALGRGELVSDQGFIDETASSLSLDSPFSELLLKIVNSPQFKLKRGAKWESSAKDFETSHQSDKVSL